MIAAQKSAYHFAITYCKSSNICSTLIFCRFHDIKAQIQKPAKLFTIFCMHNVIVQDCVLTICDDACM